MKFNKKWRIVVPFIILLLFLVISFFYFVPSQAQLNTSCVGIPDYYCTSPTLNSNGQVSFNLFFQGFPYSEYNLKFACTESNITNVPPSGKIDTIVYSNRTKGNLTVLTGVSSYFISALQCYNGTDSKLSNLEFGMPVYLSIWINYTLNNTSPTALNPYQTQKILTINTSVL